MLIVGERINSTKEKIKDAIKARDVAFIAKEARSQIDAGANYIDVNCAVTSGDELHPKPMCGIWVNPSRNLRFRCEIGNEHIHQLRHI